MSTIASSNQISRRESRYYRNRSAWRVVREWCQRQWTALSPGPQARRGVLWGILVVVAIFAIEDVIFQPSGFGLAVDVGFAVALTVAVITVITLDLQKLVGLRLKFDRTASSVICISGVGFGSQ